MVGINTNIAAQNAQANLSAANNTVSGSVSKLSSGNRIIKASDDVAGLAIGTKLQSNVTALQIGLLNANQAGTVLQIADGALKQIGDILSRQKALAVQANSGSLSNTERGFLNQEFTALTSEIDRIVDNTNFNGITLLNGSIAGDAGVTAAAPAATTSNTAAVAANVVVADPTTGSYNTTGALNYTGASILTSGDLTVNLSQFNDPAAQGSLSAATVVAEGFSEGSTTNGGESVVLRATINGTTYTAEVAANLATDGTIAASTNIDLTADNGSRFRLTLGNARVAIDTSVQADSFAAELQTAIRGLGLEQTRAVSGLTTPTTAATSKNITAATATINSSNFDVTNDDFGTIGEITLVAGSDTANSLSVTVNGTTFSASDIGGLDNSLASADTITLTGRNSGGDSTGEQIVITLTTLAASVDLTSATEVADFAKALNQLFGVSPAGTVTTSAYTTVGDIVGSNVTAIDVSSFDDATYQGEGFGTVTVSEFTEVSGDAEVATFTTTLGDKTYTAALAASSNGGAFSAQALTFTATDGSGSAFDVTIAASGTIGTLNNSTTAATIATNITAALANVDIYQTRTINSVDSTTLANTVLEGLTNTSVTVRSNAFDTTDSANVTFGDIGSFTGVAGAGALNSLSVSVNGTTFSATDLGGSNDVLANTDSTITLIGRNAAGIDNGQRLIIDISAITNSIDLTNQDGVDSLTNALNDFFGSATTGGLSFQVGSSVTDKIDVSVSSVATSSIYLNDAGVATTLSIATADDAEIAADVLDNAINTIVSRRADVGSLQSRFNFASANLQTSIANQDAARGSFLDADISSESTLFANAQVKLQASVSVLAQANQLPQNLLKLLQ
jgi:flagellin